MRPLYIIFSVGILIVLTFYSCKRRIYTACFQADTYTAAPFDTISFTNCSDFGGGYTDCVWTYGDGAIEYTKGNTGTKHAYADTGQYEIILLIGEKENGDAQRFNVTIQ